MIQVYYNNVLHYVYYNTIEYSQLHREGDEPAYIDTYGNKVWYKNGQRHREGDLPAVIYEDGSKRWYKNNNHYQSFNLTNLIRFQLLLIFLFNIKKNKQSFHPDNLVGKLIKKELYLLFEK